MAALVAPAYRKVKNRQHITISHRVPGEVNKPRAYSWWMLPLTRAEFMALAIYEAPRMLKSKEGQRRGLDFTPTPAYRTPPSDASERELETKHETKKRDADEA